MFKQPPEVFLATIYIFKKITPPKNIENFKKNNLMVLILDKS